jgi:hypothetical protein
MQNTCTTCSQTLSLIHGLRSRGNMDHHQIPRARKLRIGIFLSGILVFILPFSPPVMRASVLGEEGRLGLWHRR